MKLSCLPRTRASISNRAKKENWPLKEALGKGGSRGIKYVYKLPEYVLEEIRAKGLDYQQESTITSSVVFNEPMVIDSTATPTCPHKQLPSAKQRSKGEYGAWCQRIDFSGFVPVRYFHDIRASAGNGAINYEDTECSPLLFDHNFIYSELRVNPEHLICIPVIGDSMEPTIRTGGMAMIDTSRQYNGEGIYLIRQGEALKIKRLQQISSRKMLIISDNKEVYSAIELDLLSTESQEFAVIGKYLWHSEVAK